MNYLFDQSCFALLTLHTLRPIDFKHSSFTFLASKCLATIPSDPTLFLTPQSSAHNYSFPHSTTHIYAYIPIDHIYQYLPNISKYGLLFLSPLSSTSYSNHPSHVIFHAIYTSVHSSSHSYSYKST